MQAIKKNKSPDWSREEAILCLDVYLRIKPATPGPKLKEVLELSSILVRLADRLGVDNRPENYRTPDSVVMKMMNFRSLDENYGGAGLSARAKMDISVWKEFSKQPTRLKILAEILRKGIAA